MESQLEGSEWIVTGEFPKGNKWVASATSWDDALDWASIFQRGEFFHVRIDRRDEEDAVT